MSGMFDDGVTDEFDPSGGELFDESVRECEEVVDMKIATIEKNQFFIGMFFEKVDEFTDFCGTVEGEDQVAGVFVVLEEEGDDEGGSVRWVIILVRDKFR